MMESSSAGLPGFTSVATSLAVILSCLAIAAIIARKFRRGGFSAGGLALSPIKIVASRSIGWHSSLLVIEVEGTRFLVGHGRGSLTAIGVLNRGLDQSPE